MIIDIVAYCSEKYDNYEIMVGFREDLWEYTYKMTFVSKNKEEVQKVTSKIIEEYSEFIGDKVVSNFKLRGVFTPFMTVIVAGNPHLSLKPSKESYLRFASFLIELNFGKVKYGGNCNFIC